MELGSLLALLVTVTAVVLWLWGGRRSSISPTLVVAMFVYLMLWNFLPLLLQVTVVAPEATSAGLWTRNDLAVLQPFLILALMLLHLAFHKPYVIPIKAFLDRATPNNRHLHWGIAAALLLLLVVEFRISSLGGGSFAESVAFAVSGNTADRAQVGILEVVLLLLLGLFMGAISLGGRAGLRGGTLLLAWLGVVMFAGFAISRGMRSVVLLPVIAGMIAMTTLEGRQRRRAGVMIALAGSLTIIIGAPVAAFLGVMRQQDAASLEVARELVTAANSNLTFTEQGKLLATEVNRKFDETGPGVELLAMEPPGTGGAAPFLSATVSFVPRLIYPHKPVPTSRDGTNFGIPYRIAALAYGDPELGMVVPVSSAAIALWELGSVGLLTLVLANFFWLVVLNTLLLTKHVMARAIGFSVIGLPTFEGFFAPPSLVVQNCMRLALLVALLVTTTLFVRALRTAMQRRLVLAPPVA